MTRFLFVAWLLASCLSAHPCRPLADLALFAALLFGFMLLARVLTRFGVTPMKTDHLPALAAVYAHPRNEASLQLSAGRHVTVRPADRVLFLPDVGVLTVEGQGYRVPASLFAAVRASLHLEGVGA